MTPSGIDRYSTDRTVSGSHPNFAGAVNTVRPSTGATVFSGPGGNCPGCAVDQGRLGENPGVPTIGLSCEPPRSPSDVATTATSPLTAITANRRAPHASSGDPTGSATGFGPAVGADRPSPCT
ncbi:hypothetical protein [Kitasatospora sp. CB01950]|uniref:hypothetical protein n=1 Tax=Kitasatospora sp. CB01950 TaxID=1703930 RepID=UPI00093C9FF9|nr:hypothetical protein [Kitasatospora sp. CB01950]OKJ17348.1 hypothetical protein AMK19_04600 [Kitasatospora sp. CB01950]